MSLVRFLTYPNQCDVEGLVVPTPRHQRDTLAARRIREILTAYGKVRDNLEKHEEGYPTEEYLKSVLKEGIPKYGMEAVGEGMDSEDERPVWVLVWGGPNYLTQAR